MENLTSMAILYFISHIIHARLHFRNFWPCNKSEFILSYNNVALCLLLLSYIFQKSCANLDVSFNLISLYAPQ